MKRLTVYLTNVKKERDSNTGKSMIRNTLSFIVNSEKEAQSIVSELGVKNEISKWELSGIR